ncbi:hypothetical protein L1987_01360 [Smallanthus sonchifolius]|uniref:Uncharacterized protein n=1 Tax=Smallanthus sonchifolius TaxID=185202 RepID=A0ACB9K4V0_9ASTR|nr:hypothetical protein L1987_01360 [Smallanthus sonchifolius]
MAAVRRKPPLKSPQTTHRKNFIPRTMSISTFSLPSTILFTLLLCHVIAEPTQDKQHLLSFISKLPHASRIHWNTSDSVCTCTGVTCDSTNSSVIHLRLPAAGIVGTLLPNTIGKLTNLRVLSLRSNKLSGKPLPPCKQKLFPPPNPAPSSLEPLLVKKNKKLSEGAIIAIAVGSGLILSLLLLLILLRLRRNRNRMQQIKQSPNPPVPAAVAVASRGITETGTSTGASIIPERNSLVFLTGGIYSFDLEDLLRASAEVQLCLLLYAFLLSPFLTTKTTVGFLHHRCSALVQTVVVFEPPAISKKAAADGLFTAIRGGHGGGGFGGGRSDGGGRRVGFSGGRSGGSGERSGGGRGVS